MNLDRIGPSAKNFSPYFLCVCKSSHARSMEYERVSTLKFLSADAANKFLVVIPNAHATHWKQNKLVIKW